MYPKSLVLSLLSLAFLLSSCQKEKLVGGEKKSTIEGGALELSSSPKSLVKRKRALLLRNTLAKVLSLNPQGMCLELGRLPCADMVHKVSLGGMNAYGNAQYRTPDHASITSPVALDRLVMSACIQRAGLDLVNSAQAVIFKDVAFSADQRLIRNGAVDLSIARLYQRSFQRDPTAHEKDAILHMYERIYEEEPRAAARNWMVLSCYAVLTSIEAAFY